VDTRVSEGSSALPKRPIYVAATHQHVGKTTTCLALISGLQKRFPRSIGYLKPVGQQHVPVHSDVLNKEIQVDKDVTLVREHFGLHHLDYQHMSPVLIPKGYTKDYIDGKISYHKQLDAIANAVESISKENEVVLCEGTGHCAVGSIVGASNAKVANMIGADMVLIANGGLGMLSKLTQYVTTLVIFQRTHALFICISLLSNFSNHQALVLTNWN